jgi:enoyl-CoA hydratase
MAYHDILYETDDRLAFITLNRPEKLNALSNNLRAELMDAMREAEHDDQVGVIVLRAAGRSFSAGYDLSPSRAAADDSYVNPRSKLPDTGTTHPGTNQWARHVVMTNWTIWELAKPVVAQIQGHCLAGGTELATTCDFRIVADDAKIGYPPVRAMTTMDMMWTPWHPVSSPTWVILSRARIWSTWVGPTTPYPRLNSTRLPRSLRAVSVISITKC